MAWFGEPRRGSTRRTGCGRRCWEQEAMAARYHRCAQYSTRRYTDEGRSRSPAGKLRSTQILSLSPPLLRWALLLHPGPLRRIGPLESLRGKVWGHYRGNIPPHPPNRHDSASRPVSTTRRFTTRLAAPWAYLEATTRMGFGRSAGKSLQCIWIAWTGRYTDRISSSPDRRTASTMRCTGYGSVRSLPLRLRTAQ